MHPRLRSLALLLVTLSLGAAAPRAQTAAAPRPTLVAPAPLKLTTPEQFFGHQIGDDYVLPNYTKFTEYVRRLDAESDRMIVQSIGKTAEGRDQLMAIITAPENFKRLDRYQEIAPPALAGRGPHRRSGTRAGEGRQGGGLDRRRPARDRSAGRPAADRDDLPVRQQDRRGDAPDPARRDHPGRARQPRRDGAGLRLVHAQARSEAAEHQRHSRGCTRSTWGTTTTATST